MITKKEFTNVFYDKDGERTRGHFQDEDGGLRFYDLIPITNLTDDKTSWDKVNGEDDLPVSVPMAMVEEYE